MTFLILQISEPFNIITELLKRFAAAIPNLIAAIAVAILGWIIAKAVAGMTRRVLRAMHIDQLADKLNEIDIIAKTHIRLIPSLVLSKMIYYVLLLIFFVASTDLLGMPAVSQLMSDLINYVPSLISALMVLVIGILLAEFIKNVTLTACESLGIPSAKFIAGFIFYFVFLSVGMSALTQAKINTEFITNNLSIILAGGVFAFALGYGIASKDLMANFLASFYSKERYRIGDTITVDGATGVIIEIDSTSLVLKTEKGKTIIPLSKLTSEKVEVHQP